MGSSGQSVAALPAGCTTPNVQGRTYYLCSNTWSARPLTRTESTTAWQPFLEVEQEATEATEAREPCSLQIESVGFILFTHAISLNVQTGCHGAAYVLSDQRRSIQRESATGRIAVANLGQRPRVHGTSTKRQR